jgi:hypothetical protein
MNELRNAIAIGNSASRLSPDELDLVLSRVVKAGAQLQLLAGTDDCATPHNIAKCPIVANKVLREFVVDTSRTYFINGRRPLAGSAKSEFVLGADMTLTTAKGEQDDKTLEQVLGALPLKEYLTKELGLQPETKTEPEKSKSISVLKRLGATPSFARVTVQQNTPVYFRLTLEASPQVTLYDVSKYLEATSSSAGPSPAAVLGLDAGKAGLDQLQFESRSVAASPEKDEKEEPQPGYAINGTITLPKSPTAAASGKGD